MTDPAFPRLHARPARGWVNDPNGLCLVDGTWHVFFQYNPDAPVHGNIHWGHLSSTDLLGWREHPVALAPRPDGPDAAGCWSGCVVDDDGVPTAVYTAVPGDPRDGAVVLARSDRTLETWLQDPVPVARCPVLPGVAEARDPFVFHHEGTRYAVQGAGGRGGRPCLVLHECDDLTRWREAGVLLDSDDPLASTVAPAEVWECPNLVELEGGWVLVLSLWRSGPNGDVLDGSRWLVGDVVRSGSGLRFVPVSGGVFDDGPAWYAPQLVTVAGRTLAWGWVKDLARSPEETIASGWAGCLSLPREVGLRDGQVVMEPARELAALRVQELDWRSGAPVTEPAFEVVAIGGARLLHGSAVVVDVDGTQAHPARILVDGGVVEAFDGDGTAFTTGVARVAAGWSVEARSGSVRLFRLGLPTGA